MTQEEFEAKYPLIIGWIEQTLETHVSKARSVASLGFQRLPHYFSAELMEYAKVVYVETVPKPPLTKIGLSQFSDFENLDAWGTTYLNTFFARQDTQHNEPLHFHELVHVVQWKLLGPKRFVAAYAGGLQRFGYRNSPLEVMAYDAQDVFVNSSQPFNVETLVRTKLLIE